MRCLLQIFFTFEEQDGPEAFSMVVPNLMEEQDVNQMVRKVSTYTYLHIHSRINANRRPHTPCIFACTCWRRARINSRLVLQEEGPDVQLSQASHHSTTSRASRVSRCGAPSCLLVCCVLHVTLLDLTTPRLLCHHPRTTKPAHQILR